jgi:hypothetical protein
VYGKDCLSNVCAIFMGALRLEESAACYCLVHGRVEVDSEYMIDNDGNVV